MSLLFFLCFAGEIRLLWPNVLAKLMVAGSSELWDAATVTSMLSDVQDSASLCSASRDWRDLMKSVIVQIYKVFARFWDLWETHVRLRTMKSVSQWQVVLACVIMTQNVTVTQTSQMSLWHRLWKDVPCWHFAQKCNSDTDLIMSLWHGPWRWTSRWHFGNLCQRDNANTPSPLICLSIHTFQKVALEH